MNLPSSEPLPFVFAVATTLNPFEAKIIAVCSPMPEVTPVITHVLPLLFSIYNSPFIITSITVV